MIDRPITAGIDVGSAAVKVAVVETLAGGLFAVDVSHGEPCASRNTSSAR